jgi:hypothetical protein
MARFISIGRLERGESTATVQVEAEPMRTGGVTRWRVRARVGEGGVDLPDRLFRELFAPFDEPARAIFQQTATIASFELR